MKQVNLWIIVHTAACKHRECGPVYYPFSWWAITRTTLVPKMPEQCINKAFSHPESNPYSMSVSESVFVCVGPAFGQTEALFVTATVGWSQSLGLHAKCLRYNRLLTLLYRRPFIPSQGQEESGCGGGSVLAVLPPYITANICYCIYITCIIVICSPEEQLSF